MKSKLKLAIYEACEDGIISAEDAQTYLNFVECADLEDPDDVDVLTEMVDAISYDGEGYYESAEDYVLDYLMEKCGKGEAKKTKEKSTKNKENPEKKIAKLKANIAANKGKIAAGVGVGALTGLTIAGVKNKDKIAEGYGVGKDKAAALLAKLKKDKKAKGYDMDAVQDDIDDYSESVEDLIYESVECGDITVSEAADLLELLSE